MTEEEKFFAWLDGELPPAEAAEVERRVAADPELASIAAEHRAVAGALRGAFDQIAAEPVRAALDNAVRESPSVVSISAWRGRLSKPLARPVAQWTAMAASLALGLFAGANLTGGGDVSPVEARGGGLYAAGGVEQALETQLASASSRGDVRIGLTFRDQAGAICRTFETQASAGLACREQENWRVRGLFEAQEGSSAEYRMAAGADPRLLDLVDATITGDPFGAEQEAEARQRNWR